MQAMQISSVPLPSPEALEKYQKIDPTCLEWFKAITNEERAHRHQLEVHNMDSHNKYLRHIMAYEKLGLIAAFLAVLAALGVVAYGFSVGHSWPAGIMGGTTILGLAYAFLGKKWQLQRQKDTES